MYYFECLLLWKVVALASGKRSVCDIKGLCLWQVVTASIAAGMQTVCTILNAWCTAAIVKLALQAMESHALPLVKIQNVSFLLYLFLYLFFCFVSVKDKSNTFLPLDDWYVCTYQNICIIYEYRNITGMKYGYVCGNAVSYNLFLLLALKISLHTQIHLEKGRENDSVLINWAFHPSGLHPQTLNPVSAEQWPWEKSNRYLSYWPKQALVTGMCSQVWWCQCQFLATSPCASEIGLCSTVKVTECINLVVHWWCVVHGNLGLISRLCWSSLCITYKWGACRKLILPSAATHSCQVTYFLTDIAHVELVWVVLALCCFLQW